MINAVPTYGGWGWKRLNVLLSYVIVIKTPTVIERRSYNESKKEEVCTVKNVQALLIYVVTCYMKVGLHMALNA